MQPKLDRAVKLGEQLKKWAGPVGWSLLIASAATFGALTTIAIGRHLRRR